MASPACELELRDPSVSDQVVAAGGVARPQGERLDPLARIKNVREREQNPHGMNGHVDLASHVLDENCAGQQIVRDRRARQEVRDLTLRLLLQLGPDRGDRPGEARFSASRASASPAATSRELPDAPARLLTPRAARRTRTGRV